MFPRPGKDPRIPQYIFDGLIKGKISHLYLLRVVPFNDHIYSLEEWEVFCLCYPDENVGYLRLEVGFDPVCVCVGGCLNLVTTS